MSHILLSNPPHIRLLFVPIVPVPHAQLVVCMRAKLSFFSSSVLTKILTRLAIKLLLGLL
jgi:hypothetical protein